MATQPTPAQLEQLLAKAPKGPILMLNLLKFKEHAEYPDGRETQLSGAEAYALYGAGVGKLIAALGGRAVYQGVPNVLVIGEGDTPWDAIAIVEYPSLESFQKMLASEAYQEVHVHREAGLDHQLLINTVPIEGGFSPS